MKIFFDVDGVLIDGWHADPALRKPWDATIGQDLGVDREAFGRLFFARSDDRPVSPMMDCVSGRRDLKEALSEVLPQTGYRGGVDDFVAYWFEKDSNVSTDVFGLVERLAAADETELFVATGQEHHRARHLWDTLGFSRHFAGMFYSARIGCLKHEPRFFETINAELGIGPEEKPLFFDDTPRIVEQASAAGWDAVHFTGAHVIRDHPRLVGLFA